MDLTTEKGEREGSSSSESLDQAGESAVRSQHWPDGPLQVHSLSVMVSSLGRYNMWRYTACRYNMWRLSANILLGSKMSI